MAIDANILLRGIVPDLGSAISQGTQLGQQIKQAPMRNKLLELQSQRQEQAIQTTGQDIGQNAALAAYQVFGDTPANEITEQQFNTGIQTADRLGIPLNEQQRMYSPESVSGMASLAQAGKRIGLSKRGAGQTGFQTNAPIITEKDGQKYFTAFQTDRATGQPKLVQTPITGDIVDRLGLSAGDRVNQAQQEAIAKSSGTNIGGAQTSDIAAGTAAEEARQIDVARFQQKTAEEARGTAGGLDGQLRNIDKAITALDKGAKSGAVQGRLPAFDVATEQLRSAAKSLGIEVINSATFGALSATELQLALSTAVPDNLDEEELKQFLVEKRDATAKLRDEFNTMSRFLSKKGNTVDKWLDLQDENRATAESESATIDTPTNVGRFQIEVVQ
jgi:hypothetical protein